MGVVYGADDDRLGRQVALKFIPEDMARDRQAIERFRVEARTASGLNHPNICTVYDIGEHDGHPFIVMEWMKGQTLHDRLSTGMLKVPQIIDFGIEIADALDAAHAQGIVHRDIKPANIFLTDRGHVKVMDFGLAKLLSAQDGMTTQTQAIEALTQPGMALGTSSYMSPEQAAGDTIDGRSDLFSLGIVLYECAAGRRPFTGNSARAVLSAILHTAPVAPGLFNEDLPQRLQQVISDCLEKDPDLRYQNAASLRADLKRVKRDLESGRTASVTPAGDSRTASAPGGARVLESRTARPDQIAEPTAALSSPIPGPPSRRRLAQLAIGVVIAVGVVAAAIGYFRRPAVSDTPATTAAASSSAALVQSRLESAERSLQAKQYRDAQREADEVLVAAPGHAQAIAVRERAIAQLRQAEAGLERARKMIQAGDVRGAVRALDEARTIDPLAPGLIEVSQLMADRFKSQAEAAELELQRARAAVPAQRAAASPAPPPAPSRSAATPPAPAEASRESSAAIVPAAPQAPPPVPSPIAEPRTQTEPPESAAIKPAPSPVAERQPPADAVRESDDDSAIRAVVAAYARAIESKDLALFRSIKPNLRAEEERRIQQGFRAVSSQKVNVTIASIDRRGDQASVLLRRQDIIEASGRRQSADSRQTMTLAKSKGAWVIVEIGR